MAFSRGFALHRVMVTRVYYTRSSTPYKSELPTADFVVFYRRFAILIALTAIDDCC